jgi:hypothetical protein
LRVRIVSEEQAAKERASKSTIIQEIEPTKEKSEIGPNPPANSTVETNERWLLDEQCYMKYKKYDNTGLIPIIRNQYPAKWGGFRSGNRADVMSLSLAYLMKIKDIMNTCQQKWP